MPTKRMQFPKLPALEAEGLTPFQRFRILARKVVSVPKDAIRESKRDKPQPS